MQIHNHDTNQSVMKFHFILKNASEQQEKEIVVEKKLIQHICTAF